jgi:hypothetical protein
MRLRIGSFGTCAGASPEQAADLYALSELADRNERMEIDARRVDGFDFDST